jgi:hypothetical protein
MRERPDLKTISDDKLLGSLFDVLKQARHNEADLVAHIAEVDARELYARQAAPSMFAWCTQVLHLSESEAYLRIAVARASRRHPMLLAMLADGRLHLSGIERLAPHLTEKNRDVLLRRAVHKSKRQIEQLVAELAPRPATPTTMRKLPATRTPHAATGGSVPTSELRPSGVGAADGGLAVDGVAPTAPKLRPAGVAAAEGGVAVGGVASAASELRPAGVVAPVSRPNGAVPSDPELRPDGVPTPSMVGPRPTRAPEAVAPARFRLQFDLDAEFKDKLERLQALMRSSVPDGNLGKVIELAVTRELERLEARRFAKTKRPRKRLAQTDTRPKSRYIPAAVRRFVEKRDGGRCAYRDRHGRRCTKRHDLEFHHRMPFGLGGDHSAEGLALMCRTHNSLLAEEDFGKEKMARYRRRASRDTRLIPKAVGGAAFSE